MGGPVTQPGLHLKVPFIQDVHRFDKRWLEFEGSPNQIPTRDKKYIWVETYARWRIIDPLKFYQNVGDERGAQSRLDDIIDGQTRNAVASFDLLELVQGHRWVAKNPPSESQPKKRSKRLWISCRLTRREAV